MPLVGAPGPPHTSQPAVRWWSRPRRQESIWGRRCPARTAVPRLAAQQQCMDRGQPGPMAARPQHRWQRGMHQPGTSTGGITPASPWEHPPTGRLSGPGATPARLEQPTVVPEAHGNWCFQHNTTPAPNWPIGAFGIACSTNRCLRPVTTTHAALFPPSDSAATSEFRAGPGLGSVLVSFAPVRHRSPVVTLTCSRRLRTLTDAGERWCTVLESV